jgi:serine/threonine protein kinase
MRCGYLEADRWQTVEELFHATLEQPTADRRAFLDEACGSDVDLYAEIASLLAALEAPEAFRELAASELTRQWIGETTPEPSALSYPERLGPYRLIGVLGEGGMGTVYLAEQSEPLPRRVALKLMHWGDAHGRALRRFEFEREALARMSHPTIAQVFGAGATEHGQPYVALEYIPGQPITEYCDSRRLDVRQRLRLLTAVCDGVRHAHEKAVIHRDLKPSNILVTEAQGDPLPKIIDFGIAKCLEPWSDSAAQTTRSRFRVGSPGYMSPEAVMAGSQAVDTRSDVYSLGVVLCQLLIGVRPFDALPDHRAAEAVRDPFGDPPRPSRRFRALPPDERREIAGLRRTHEGQLVRQLRGELDWIVLRAVAPDPADRYGSVAELAADVERWLTRHPVAARPPSFLYRATKALRRHLAVSAAAVLVLATVAVFGIRSRLLFHRAEASRTQAEELVSFMLDDLSAHLAPMGRLDLLESVARHSLAYFESGAGGPAPPGRHPAVALRQIGRVLADRGDLQAAQEAYERARSIDRRRWQESPAAPTPRLDLASDLALLAEIHDVQGEQRLANLLLDEAEGHLRSLVAEFPGHVPARLALAKTLGTVIGPLQRQQGNTAPALALFEEALDMLGDLRRDRPQDLEVSHVLGDTRYNLGLLELYARQDLTAAIRWLEAGTAVFQELADKQPEASIWRYRLAVLKGQGLVTAYRDSHRLAEAQAANREALGLLETLVREEPTNTRWRHGYAWELIRQAGIARKVDDLDLAASAYRRSAEVHTDLLARATGPNNAWLDGLANAYEGLADVEARRGALDAALAAAEAALAGRRRITVELADVDYLQTMLALTAVTVGELHSRLNDVAGARDAGIEAAALLEPIDESQVGDAVVLEMLLDARRRAAHLMREAV